MDLGAYMQIEKYKELAEKNGIEVPRLRGYRLMKDEKPVDIGKLINDPETEAECCEDLVRMGWKPYLSCYSYGGYTDKRIKRLIVPASNGGTKVRWDRIHGRRRKMLKTMIHNKNQREIKQWIVWNKYVGRDDVLYIHARIGGDNWSEYGCGDISQKPWYLESVDDSFDSTYCDIYAKIDPEV